MTRLYCYLFILSCLFIFSCNSPTSDQYISDWPTKVNRSWIGPEYWTNRLQDWELQEGRLVCLVSAPNRNAYLLTRELDSINGTLDMSVKVAILNQQHKQKDSSWVGVRIGAKGQFNDYRDNALYGEGLNVGMTADGYLFIKSPEYVTSQQVPLENGELSLRWELEPEGKGETYTLRVAAYSANGETALASTLAENISAQEVVGGIALVSHFAEGDQQQEQASAAFRDWSISGTKVKAYPERTFGPILFSQHTLSKQILTMTAQMPPIGKADDQVVGLEIEREGSWKKVGEASIHPLARTATFEVPKWVDTANVPYRLTYQMWTHGDKQQSFFYEGVIRKNPVDKEELVVAGFTGNNDLGFPNSDLFENVQKQNPDMLFFSGDQIYERVAGYGIQTTPISKAALDYLRKWYLYGWAFGDLMRDRPTVAIPDDHDVYHGNIWGEGGKAAQKEGTNFDRQDSGGFKMPAEWVNMVIRTQTSHLPAPYDPTPMKQGIQVFYTDMSYGGVSFAIIEDRYFKSAPKALLPTADINNGWAQNRSFNPKTQADAPEAVLLGPRQLRFLEEWVGDWSGGVWMKMLLSQTIFANVATLPEAEIHDKIVPKLRILNRDEYAEDDRPVADMDSNGWPQTGRDKALSILRKGFAFHLAGDQHLGSTIQYGIDTYGDASYALCVPSVSNVWPRRWYPPEPGGNHQEGMPRYAGNFEDGFGNKMTVLAVSNPYFTGREPAILYDRATGYGIARLHRENRTISMANWARDTDPTTAGALPYEGWPIVIDQLDNYGREAVSYLPNIAVVGMEDPVLQVIDEETDEMVYTLRMRGTEFRPMVFRKGTYTVRVGEPGTDRMRTLAGVEDGSAATVRIEF